MHTNLIADHLISFAKRQAKKRKNTSSIQHADALQAVAMEFGFESWKELTRLINTIPVNIPFDVTLFSEYEDLIQIYNKRDTRITCTRLIKLAPKKTEDVFIKIPVVQLAPPEADTDFPIHRFCYFPTEHSFGYYVANEPEIYGFYKNDLQDIIADPKAYVEGQHEGSQLGLYDYGFRKPYYLSGDEVEEPLDLSVFPVVAELESTDRDFVFYKNKVD